MIHADNEVLVGAKRNEISSHEKMWKDLKCILLSEVNQCEKATYCMIQLKGPGLPQD